MIAPVILALELFYVIHHNPVAGEGYFVHFLEPALVLNGSAVSVSVIGHWVELTALGSAVVYLTYALLEKNTFAVQLTHSFQALIINSKIHVVIAH